MCYPAVAVKHDANSSVFFRVNHKEKQIILEETMTNTFEKVAKIIADNRDVELEKIQMDSTFADLGLDSLDTVELVMTMEEDFGVTLEMNEDIKTVGDVVKLIDSLL